MNKTKILGTGSYLPKKILTNDELSRLIDTTDEWIEQRTGIRARHMAAKGETTSDMATRAARRALDKAGAYGIQEIEEIFIEKIGGDYDNVVGLPLRQLQKILQKIK